MHLDEARDQIKQHRDIAQEYRVLYSDTHARAVKAEAQVAESDASIRRLTETLERERESHGRINGELRLEVENARAAVDRVAELEHECAELRRRELKSNPRWVRLRTLESGALCDGCCGDDDPCGTCRADANWRAQTTPQPMATAPRDTDVIGWFPESDMWDRCWYSSIDNEWLRADDTGETPTHWLPMPEAPK